MARVRPSVTDSLFSTVATDGQHTSPRSLPRDRKQTPEKFQRIAAQYSARIAAVVRHGYLAGRTHDQWSVQTIITFSCVGENGVRCRQLIDVIFVGE